MAKKEEEFLNEDIIDESTGEMSAVQEATGTSTVKKASKKGEKRWYIVHTYSGYENKVKGNLEKRIEYMNMSDKIFRVEVPQRRENFPGICSC